MALNAIGLPRGPVVMNEPNKYVNQNFMQSAPPIMKANDIPKVNAIQVREAKNV